MGRQHGIRDRYTVRFQKPADALSVQQQILRTKHRQHADDFKGCQPSRHNAAAEKDKAPAGILPNHFTQCPLQFFIGQFLQIIHHKQVPAV